MQESVVFELARFPRQLWKGVWELGRLLIVAARIRRQLPIIRSTIAALQRIANNPRSAAFGDASFEARFARSFDLWKELNPSFGAELDELWVIVFREDVRAGEVKFKSLKAGLQALSDEYLGPRRLETMLWRTRLG